VVTSTKSKVKAQTRGSGKSGELFIFARFNSRKGRENLVSSLLSKEVAAAREDPGCLAHQAYHSTRDPNLFFIHSRWVDEAAFEAHLKMQHTILFAKNVEPLLDHELHVTRARPIDTNFASLS
jgi:quinol monooxygenase YgiN